MTGFSFEKPPVIGVCLFLDTQRYELCAVEGYQRKDGANSHLLTWRTSCPGCQSRFEIKTGLAVKSLNRRCRDCAKPGATVSGKKRSKRVKVEVPE